MSHDKHTWPSFDEPEDLEFIDRTRINVWLKRCIDSAPKDLHTSVARDLVAGLLAKIQDDIEVVNAVPDERSLSLWL